MIPVLLPSSNTDFVCVFDAVAFPRVPFPTIVVLVIFIPVMFVIFYNITYPRPAAARIESIPARIEMNKMPLLITFNSYYESQNDNANLNSAGLGYIPSCSYPTILSLQVEY